VTVVFAARQIHSPRWVSKYVAKLSRLRRSRPR